MRNIVWMTMLVAISMILVACGSQAPPEPLELTIDMKEYAFEPANLEFKVGQYVTLHLTNSGTLEHEIMFGRDVMMSDGRPNGYMVDMFESSGVEPIVSNESSDAEHTEGDEHTEDEHTEDEHTEDEHAEDQHAHSGFMVQVPATHDIYTMSFTVTEDMVGDWEIGCFLLDGVHYDSGMIGSLTVSQ